MASQSGIVEGEWEHQPRNWRTFFRRWRRSQEQFRFEVIRTESMSSKDFFVIGRTTSGSIKAGSKVRIQLGEESVLSQVISIDQTVQGQGGTDGEDFHMLLALKLADVGPDSGIEPGMIIQQAE